MLFGFCFFFLCVKMPNLLQKLLKVHHFHYSLAHTLYFSFKNTKHNLFKKKKLICVVMILRAMRAQDYNIKFKIESKSFFFHKQFEREIF